MKQLWVWTGALSLGVVVGCGGGGDYQTADKLPQTAHDHDHSHDHGHDHDHDHDHDHAELGPNHGVLVELGQEEYHAELVVDEPAQKLKLFLLGPDAKTLVATSTPQVQVKVQDGPELILKPVDGQLENQITAYELVDAAVVKQILSDGFLHGTLTIVVSDKPYTAEVDAHFHADHDRPDLPAKDQLSPATSPSSAESAAPAEAK